MSDLNLFQQFEQGDENTASAEFDESIDLAWPSPAQSMQQELNHSVETEDQATVVGHPSAAASAQLASEIDLATKSGRHKILEVRNHLATSTNFARTCRSMKIKLFMSYTASTQAPAETIASIENGIRHQSTRQVRQAFSTIVAYSWFLPEM